MNKLALSVILAGLASAAACTTVDDGTINVAWNFTPGCPTNAQIELTAEDTITKERFTQSMPCQAMSTSTMLLPEGEYDVWLQVYDGSHVYGTSLSTLSDVFYGETTPVLIADFALPTGTLDLTWSSTPGCPTNDTAASLVMMHKASGMQMTQVFDCSANAGVADNVFVGEYDVWVEIRSADLSILYGSSPASALTVTDGTRTVADLAAVPAGDITFRWSIVDGANQNLACVDAGVGGIKILATLANTSDASATIFACDNVSPSSGEGTSDPLFVGTHTVIVEALDTNDLKIADGGTEEVTLAAGENKDLGPPFIFEFN
jgi:hypothetical protein